MDFEALTHMTVNKLREEAKKFPEVKGISAMKKDELIALLAEKLEIEVPTHKPKPHKHKPTLDKKTLKAKIKTLKEERAQARANAEKKKVDMLRRQIHRLKRQMRFLD